MRIRTGPTGLTAEMDDLRVSRPLSKASQREQVGFKVREWHGFGAIFDDGRLVAVVESEGEAEQVLRDGAAWKQQRMKSAQRQRKNVA